MTPWTVAHQASLSMEFRRQEYWGRLPFLSPGDLPSEEEPTSPALQAGSLPQSHQRSPCLKKKKKDFFLGTVREILMLTKKEEGGISRGKH